MLKKFSTALLSLAIISGCSSIVSDSTYPVLISSTPSQADFVLQNKAGEDVSVGKTPETITLNASSGFFEGETYKLILNKKGYDEKVIEIESSLDGWYFGNILFGGIIGLLIVDPATGAMFKLPESVDAELSKTGAKKTKTVTKETAPSLTIKTLDSIPEKQRADLVKIN